MRFRIFGLLLLIILAVGGCTPAARPADPAPAPPPPQSEEPVRCEPYDYILPNPLPGRFVVKGGELSYAVDGAETRLLNGPAPKVFGNGVNGVLLTDGAQLFWFDPVSKELAPIADLPVPVQAAYRGDALLLGSKEELSHWRPGSAPKALPVPEHLVAIYGLSISPDGRYGVAAFSLEIPQGPRAGVIWAYDLVEVTVLKWPTETPKAMYGLWLLGWSGDHTLRFMTGVRGYNAGHTWSLPDDDPSEPDGTEYQMMEDAAISPDGTWFAYRPIPERIAVQPVQPDSEPQVICRAKGTLGEPRVLLNGHIAFWYDQAWWELQPDGALTRMEGVDGLY